MCHELVARKHVGMLNAWLTVHDGVASVLALNDIDNNPGSSGLNEEERKRKETLRNGQIRQRNGERKTLEKRGNGRC